MGDYKFYEMSLRCTQMVSQIISPLLRTDNFLYIIQQALAFFFVSLLPLFAMVNLTPQEHYCSH